MDNSSAQADPAMTAPMTSPPPSARAEELLHKILWEGCSLAHATAILLDVLNLHAAAVWEEAAEIIETMWPGHKTLGVPHSLAEKFRARAAAMREGGTG